MFCISTNGFVRGGIFDDQYKYACNILDGKAENVHFLSFIYELDDREEWTDPAAWIKANPGLGTIKKVSFLRECVQKAKDDPAFLPTVLVKDFNFPENRSSAWLQWQHIHNDFEADLEKLHLRYGVGGFDAADSVDLNAAVALGMIPGDPHIYARAMFWLPEDVLAAQTTDGNRRERDEAPYLLWERQGLLRSYPGSKVDKHVFLDWFRELRDDDDFYIIYIAYDPWHIDDTLLREFKQEFGERCMIPVRQGSLTLSAPMKELKADLAAGRIVHNNNPVLQMCLTSTTVFTFAELCSLFGSLKRCRRMVAYVNNATLYKQLVALVDAQGRPIFQQTAQEGAQGAIIGAVIHLEDEAGDGCIVVGDPSRIRYNMVQDVMVETDKDIKNHEYIYSGYARGQGALIDDQSFAMLSLKTG